VIEIRVRDDGVGIDPEMLPRVFDAFLQADRSMDRAHGGLGLGLTLVRSLVELHGGTVEVTSGGRGQGSEFSVRLPLKQPAPDGRSESSVAAQTDPAQDVTRRILVVDDQADTRETLGWLLRGAGHVVRAAADGDSALEIAKEFHPEVVFLDIGLPGMDGFELAHRLRAQHGERELQLVAVSGYGQEMDRSRGREAGFDHYFTKPVDFQTLRDVLSRHTEPRS
jgi:CheY-like chemotaxis protein